MTALWSGFVEVLQLGIFTLTQFYGGQLGPALLSFGLLARLGLLPLTMSIALRSRAQTRRVKALQPSLEKLRIRWKDDPTRLVQETLALYERQGVQPVDPAVLKGSLIQAPLFIGLFQSIRGVLAGTAARQSFLWVTNLAKSDLLVAILVGGLVGLGVAANGSPTGGSSRYLVLISCLGTLVMLLRFSSGFGLYMGASAVVSTLQGLLVRRREARAASAA